MQETRDQCISTRCRIDVHPIRKHYVDSVEEKVIEFYAPSNHSINTCLFPVCERLCGEKVVGRREEQIKKRTQGKDD